MPISLNDVQYITELSSTLYDFLPANPHPYADQNISFQGCAIKVGVGKYWSGGSKKPAVTNLLKNTLEFSRDHFCPLILCIVKVAIAYRSTKSNHLTREELLAVNNTIAKIGYKIPELWNPEFLKSLPTNRNESESKEPKFNDEINDRLRKEFINLSSLEPQPRGYAFQRFLNFFFDVNGLNPRSPFRLIGEEIDESFEHNTHIYLLEAKWHGKPTPESDLLVFSGKVSGKATWTRGLFISYTGFSKEGLDAFSRGKRTNIIGMDAQDIFFILEGRMSLLEALSAKIRRAGETNSFYVSVFNLSN